MRRSILALILLYPLCTLAQDAPRPDVLSYIEQYRALAVEEMVRTGVPAAIKLAQGIIETQAGTRELVMRSNNHFGIKCKSSWTGDRVHHDDDEKGECFRKYGTAEDSWRDHSDFLRTQLRYASLFRLDPADYAGWARGLKAAGYATDPTYPERLIRYIESYRLNEHSLAALAGMQRPVPRGDTLAAPPETPVVEAGPRLHKVEPGETLYGLSRRYGVDPREIMQLNGLASPGLLAGTVIRIPVK